MKPRHAELIKKAADLIETLCAENATLRKRLSQYERISEAQEVANLMVQKGLRADVSEEDIKKLASSDHLFLLKEIVNSMAPRLVPWSVADEVPNAEANPELRRDAWLRGEDV